MKWSYKTVNFELKKEGLLGGAFLDEAEIEEQLNQFGRAGWELISVIEVQNGIICFFRQPLSAGGGMYMELSDDTGDEQDQSEDDSFTPEKVDDQQREADQLEADRRQPHGEESADEAEVPESVYHRERADEPELYEPEIDAYEVYDEPDESDGYTENDAGVIDEPELYETDDETADELRESADDSDDDVENNRIGAIRIE